MGDEARPSALFSNRASRSIFMPTPGQTDLSFGKQGTLVEMKDTTQESPQRKSPHHPAFIFYYPQAKKNGGQIFYNEEAWRILSLKGSLPAKNRVSPSDLGSLCSKWKVLLDRSIRGNGSGQTADPGPVFIETIQSYRRRYTVKGVILSGGEPDEAKQERPYLFLMDRVDQEGLHLSQVLRQLNLNRREQEIARLLVRGLGNKEIAYALGLSLNTIKGYMKLLMGKLAVRSRVEIVSTLLTKRLDSTGPSSSYPLSSQAPSTPQSLT